MKGLEALAKKKKVLAEDLSLLFTHDSLKLSLTRQYEELDFASTCI